MSFFEPEAVSALQNWLFDRPILCPAPFDYPVIPEVERNISHVDREVKEFLDNALKTHGPHSVVYVCH